MIEQHKEIIKSNISDADKIAQLYDIVTHLYKVFDEISESHNELLYLQSVCRRASKKGFYLKVDQFGAEYKATFWRGKGDGVETYSHAAENLVEAIERAGTNTGSQEAMKIIREGYERNGIELLEKEI